MVYKKGVVSRMEAVNYLKNELKQYSYMKAMNDSGEKGFEDRIELVNDLLNYLDDDLSEQTKLIYIEGKSFKQVADMYDSIIPTVQKRIEREFWAFAKSRS